MKAIIKIFTIVLLLASFCLQAQNEDDLPNDQVEVIKNFQARLAVSDKLKISPQLPDNSNQRLDKLNYSIYPQSLKVEYEPPTIRPLALPRDKSGPSYKAYLEGGYGIPRSPYAFGAYEHSEDEWGFGIGIDHYSANENDINHLTLSQTSGNIKGNYLVKDQMNVFGGFNYNRDKRYYNLVYNDGIPLPDSTESRLIQNWKIYTGIENIDDTELGINYKAELSYEKASDELNTIENLFRTDFSINKYLDDRNPIGLDFGTYLATYKSPEFENQELSAFYANPYFKFGFDKFSFKIGADLWTDDNEPSLYPDVDLMVNLKDNEWVLFAESEGYFTPSDFISNFNLNPFLKQAFMVNFQKVLDISAGVRGNVRGINFTMKGGWQSIENLPLYINDSLVSNRFFIEYDTATVSYINLEAEYQLRDDIQLFTSLNKKFYNLENRENPLHIPDFRWTFGANYWTLEKKLLLGLKLFVENGVYYLDESNNEEQLNGLFDISFESKYAFTDQFGLFLKLNNLANNERERLRYYPTFGFNGLAGLFVKF